MPKPGSSKDSLPAYSLYMRPVRTHSSIDVVAGGSWSESHALVWHHSERREAQRAGPEVCDLPVLQRQSAAGSRTAFVARASEADQVDILERAVKDFAEELWDVQYIMQLYG